MDPATILIGGGIALAFLLFSGKKKRRGAAPRDVQPDIIEPVDQDDELPEAPPKKPGTATVPPLPGGAVSFPSPSEEINALHVFHTRPNKVSGHVIDRYNLNELASGAFWLSYPATAKMPGGKLPNRGSLKPGLQQAWDAYASAWQRIRDKIGALHNDYRLKIFFSNNCKIVVVGRGYLENIKGSIAGLVSIQPAGTIAENFVNAESEAQFGERCPDTFGVRSAKKGIAIKIIDRYGGHP